MLSYQVLLQFICKEEEEMQSVIAPLFLDTGKGKKCGPIIKGIFIAVSQSLQLFRVEASNNMRIYFGVN